MTPEQERLAKDFGRLLIQAIRNDEAARRHVKIMLAAGVGVDSVSVIPEFYLFDSTRRSGAPSDTEFLRSLRIVPDVEPRQ